MDLLEFIKQQGASGPNNRGFGPGTPGYLASKLGGLTNYQPEPIAPVETAPVDEGGGFWDALNPSEIGINLGDIGSRALDILSRPSYAVNNMIQETIRQAKEGQENGFQVTDPLAAIMGGFTPGQAWQGISGQQKVLGQQALEEIPGFEKQHEALQFIEGLGVDLFADPTTYIGAGAVKSVAKGGVDVAKALTGVGRAAKAESEIMDVATDTIKAGSREWAKPEVTSARVKPAEAPTENLEKDLADTGISTPEPTKAPEVETPTPASTTPMLTTNEVPSMSASFSTPIKITPSSRGFIESVHDFSQAPIPLGRKLEGEETAFMAPGSTTKFNQPSAMAAGNADDAVEDMHNFLDSYKGRTREQLKQEFAEGRIRPTADTPAERALAASLDMNGLVSSTRIQKAKVNLPKKDFHTSPKYSRENPKKYYESATGPIKDAEGNVVEYGAKSSDVGEVFIKSGKGNWVSREIDSPLLWSALNGKARKGKVRIRTGSTTKEVAAKDVYVKGYHGNFESLNDIARQTKKQLDDPAWWENARKRALHYTRNPQKLAERIAQQNVDYLRVTAKDTLDDFDEWAKELKATVPGLDKTSIKAAYDAVNEVLNTSFQKFVKSPEKDIRKFLAAAESSQQLRQIMTQAVATHAAPEELVVSAAHVKRNLEIKLLNVDLAKITESAAPAEVKVEAAAGIKAEAEAIEQETRAIEETASHADEVRMEKAQQSNNPAGAVRQATTVSDLSDKAAGAIEGHTWSRHFSKDQAIGAVRRAALQVNETMNKPKNYAEFHQMNQAGVVNLIVGEIAKKDKQFQAFVKKMIRANPEMSAEYGGNIAAAMRAVEHQIDATGRTPNAWNGATKAKAKGWTVGTPGKTQTTRSMPFKPGENNIPFSSSKLMDDMISHDMDLTLRTGKSEDILVRALSGADETAKTPLWTHVVSAALFKDAPSLAKIKAVDKTLYKYLLNYDPMENIRSTSANYLGKVQPEVKAQATTAEKASADSFVNDSPARHERVVDETNKATEEAIERNPVSPIMDKEAIGDQSKLASKGLSEALEHPTPVDAAVTNRKAFLAVRSSGDLPRANSAAQKVMREAGSEPADLGKTISDAKWNQSIVNRLESTFKPILQGLSTHIGARAVRPAMQDAFGYVNSIMGFSRRRWNNAGRALEKAVADDPNKMKQFIMSLNSANVVKPPEGLEELQRTFRKYMESTLGGSGVEKYIKGNSTVTRSGVDREMINEWLRVYGVKSGDEPFQFSGAKVTDDVGTTHDYSNDMDWLKEWETCLPLNASPRELVAFMHGIERAVSVSVIERHLFDDLAVRFGTKGGATVNHPYLQGVTFHPEIASQVDRMVEMIDQLHKPGKNNPFFNYYDTMLRGWKSGVTIYNPAHHIRNAFGDTYLLAADMGFLEAGRSMKQAAALFHKFGMLDDEFDTGLKAGQLRIDPALANDPEALIKSMTAPVAEGVSHIKNKATGVRVSDDQLMQAMTRHGIFQPAHQIEDIMETSADDIFGGKIPQGLRQPAGGRINEAATRLAEAREHRIRAAHFIAAVKKSKVKRIKGETEEAFKKRLFEDAARRTRKWHPDGSDMTKFERNVARRVIPFYSWQRKSIPLILEGALRNPHVATAYPKAQREITYSATGEAVPSDQLFPDFLTQGSPMAFFGESTMTGGPEAGYTGAKGPSTPFNDLIPFANDPLGQSLQMTSPFIRVPAEIAAGKQFTTEQPLETMGEKAEYIGEQVPNVGTLVRNLTNKNPGQNEVLNWLLAAGLVDTGEYTGTAYWDAKARAEAGG